MIIPKGIQNKTGTKERHLQRSFVPVLFIGIYSSEELVERMSEICVAVTGRVDIIELREENSRSVPVDIGIYAANLAGNQVADKRHGVLHILISKLEHSVSCFFQGFDQIDTLDRPMCPAEFGE